MNGYECTYENFQLEWSMATNPMLNWHTDGAKEGAGFLKTDGVAENVVAESPSIPQRPTLDHRSSRFGAG